MCVCVCLLVFLPCLANKRTHLEPFSPLLLAHAHKRRYLYSDQNSDVTDIDFLQKFRNVGDLAKFLSISATFYCACAEMPSSELPATILTTPLDSAIPISYESGKFRQSESIYGRFRPFFFAHAQIRHYLCFRSEICYLRSQRHRFPVKGWKILRFDNVYDNF